LNALRRARRAADKAGLKIYGRAFADPDKGAAGASLSALQGRKLKEISAKASGKPMRVFGRRSRPQSQTSEDEADGDC
jgi:hypothetical protein